MFETMIHGRPASDISMSPEMADLIRELATDLITLGEARVRMSNELLYALPVNEPLVQLVLH